MFKCTTVERVKFYQRSLEAIKNIRDIRSIGKVLNPAIVASNLVLIFNNNNVLDATFTIYNTDFETLAKILETALLVVKKSIRDEAYFACRDTQGKEKRFWMSVLKGCRILE